MRIAGSRRCATPGIRQGQCVGHRAQPWWAACSKAHGYLRVGVVGAVATKRFEQAAAWLTNSELYGAGHTDSRSVEWGALKRGVSVRGIERSLSKPTRSCWHRRGRGEPERIVAAIVRGLRLRLVEIAKREVEAGVGKVGTEE